MSEESNLSHSTLSRRALLFRTASAATTAAGVLPLMGILSPQPSLGRSTARPTPAAGFGADVATAWFDQLLVLIRSTPGYSPPVASRAIGYAGVALYESVVGGMPEHRTSAGLLNGLPSLMSPGRDVAHHWPSVANAALAELLRQLFPAAPLPRLADVDRLEAAFLAPVPRGIAQRSSALGREIAAGIAAWSAEDGGHEGYLRNFPSDYVPPEGAGLWQPTPPGFASALQPWWGDNRTFLAVGAESCEPEPPVAFSTDPASAFFAQADEVYTVVNGLTSEQLAIARFWSDDPGATATPPGHSVSILSQVLRMRDASLADAAEAYARLGVAAADAFIACWRTKYVHNLLRPITYIRANIDPEWGDPLPLNTPPFPEYTSGHSVQSAAAAEVLSALYGEIPFVDDTHQALGLPARSFASFDAAANEAAISRFYGGIHFRAAIDEGLSQGRCIGRRVLALPLRG